MATAAGANLRKQPHGRILKPACDTGKSGDRGIISYAGGCANAGHEDDELGADLAPTVAEIGDGGADLAPEVAVGGAGGVPLAPKVARTGLLPWMWPDMQVPPGSSRRQQPPVEVSTSATLRTVEFHGLGISEYVTPLPDPTAASPFPTHLMPLFEAYTAGARAPLAALLVRLSVSHRRVVVVHDRITAYAAEEAARLPNAESFGLHCLPASTFAGKTGAGLRFLRERGLAFVDVASCASEEFAEYIVKSAMPTKEISPGAGILVNSCRALEGEFMNLEVPAYLARKVLGEDLHPEVAVRLAEVLSRIEPFCHTNGPSARTRLCASILHPCP